ncbi:DASH complex subunit dam1 [Malassezia vespertilionis]|uniref:DASH complex subunit dam1 n=1 Tax=Malassezia vespertilionis TaxID=2020962 RepID=UPI0024B07E60|nr:DASH complex subunit dam1 [Malassezia vespertilionis]WFD04766.1 DASH complex subunit dam1 [Malassezia vespertilionis]
MASTPRKTSTPIRRISSGSFLPLGSRSQHPHTPLSFLADEALPILAEEMSALQENLQQTLEIQHALSTFNEGFATFLYGIKMNAFCVEWPEAPSEEDILRVQARRGMLWSLLTLALSAAVPMPAQVEYDAEADQTYRTDTDAESGPIRQRKQSVRQSTVPRAQQTAKESRALLRSSKSVSKSTTSTAPRRRKAFADQVLDTMPLEYRNGEQQREVVQSVILALLSASGTGLRVADIAKQPVLPAGKVNKALIALLAANHVVRASNNVWRRLST